MAKTICIFSDGTGQAGGVNPINWTNVYRLFVATRDVDPPGQLCFYDPGLGANPDTGETRGLFQRARDWLAQATGLGITENIVDCYAALLLSYEPGDRIVLFGFSRGAYTVRSLGGVLGLCGIPPGLPKVAGWQDFADAIKEPGLRALADKAVSGVYMIEDKDERLAAAATFQRAHGCTPCPPYFIGVWDTVPPSGCPPSVRRRRGTNSTTRCSTARSAMAARRWRSTRTGWSSHRSSGTRAARRRVRSGRSGLPASTPMSAAATA